MVKSYKERQYCYSTMRLLTPISEQVCFGLDE